jgi:hypothetical protein
MSRVLEQGDVFFFHHPRVDVEEVGEPLRERFGGRRFRSVDPLELLDFEGAEAELGIELDPDTERLREADVFALLRRQEAPLGKR